MSVVATAMITLAKETWSRDALNHDFPWFQTPQQTNVELVELVVLVFCCLHGANALVTHYLRSSAAYKGILVKWVASSIASQCHHQSTHFIILQPFGWNFKREFFEPPWFRGGGVSRTVECLNGRTSGRLITNAAAATYRLWLHRSIRCWLHLRHLRPSKQRNRCWECCEWHRKSSPIDPHQRPNPKRSKVKPRHK